MIDRKTESDIKSLKSFIEFWGGFHSMYTEAVSKGVISDADDIKFLETRDLIKSKYEEVKGDLEFRYMPHGRLTDPVGDILSVSSIRSGSEKTLKKLERDWKDSYVFLNNIMERLKSKKRRLEEFSLVGVFFKRMRERK